MFVFKCSNSLLLAKKDTSWKRDKMFCRYNKCIAELCMICIMINMLIKLAFSTSKLFMDSCCSNSLSSLQACLFTLLLTHCDSSGNPISLCPLTVWHLIPKWRLSETIWVELHENEASRAWAKIPPEITLCSVLCIWRRTIFLVVHQMEEIQIG